jgi:spermidine synthase
MARFTNHMIVSDKPLDWDFKRWREVLQSYVIDGKKEFRADHADESAALDSIISPDNVQEMIEECPQLLARTEGKSSITDDNMGTEWRYPIGLE